MKAESQRAQWGIWLLLMLLAGCRSEQAYLAASGPLWNTPPVVRATESKAVVASVAVVSPAGLADFSSPTPLGEPVSLQNRRLTKPKSQTHPKSRLAASMTAPKPAQPAASAANAPRFPQSREGGRVLNGVLLLVPVLAILAVAGVSLAVGALFSIGFWPALGWTTLAVAGALLLALAVAILRGK